jgi:hypothetical protein
MSTRQNKKEGSDISKISKEESDTDFLAHPSLSCRTTAISISRQYPTADSRRLIPDKCKTQ